MTESFKQLLEESFSDQVFHPGMIIRGTVVRIEKDRVVVNANLKSEGLIPIEQFYDESGELEVAVGDEVDVSIESLEDGFGETRLSREKAKRAEMWTALQTAHDEGSIIKGLVTGKVKGGFTVELGNIRAFLPGSLVDVRPLRDSNTIEGKELEFKVIKLDPKRNNIVLSRRAVLESEGQAGREQLLAELEEGQVIKGIVKNLADYGAFIDLGGIDGLLHVTDISWKRVKNPSEVLAIGDETEVLVLKIEKERGRVSLGLKQLAGDPWADLVKRYPVGTRLKGKITNVTDYGCFVEVEEGVEGLVHVSEMDWTNKNINPNKIVQVGMEIEVVVLDIDLERRRISLGIKQCQSNPWEDFSNNHMKGERIRGKLKSITDFGLFIGLPGGIDGLVHLSDIAWNMSGEEAVRKYKKGDELETIILSIDPERERISLGIKQLELESDESVAKVDPFDAYHENQWVRATVKEVTPERIHVELSDQIEAELLSSELGDDAMTFTVDQEINARILTIDHHHRRIELSLIPSEEKSST
ncbi:30S ribosomal protein S1 [Rickettsiella massiliensis]|uniref:30S ribosomal protein S1 n=1 Tax=Rickettsiella massiliensis TaxID=676517 RepID=UPI000299F27D|nr:30S ribosomal protein S1 [Rickettsiella massiliensis]